MNRLLLALTLICISSLASTSQAQVIAPQPCDPQFYAQMNARAWQESEREIMQNQNLIFKADSVLEYTCFDRFANVTAHAGGDIFTHSEYFDGQLIPRGAPYGLEEILQNIIITSIEAYQATDDEGGPPSQPGTAGNFEHNLLGGRGDDMIPEMEKRPYDPTTDQLDYECTVMAEVWERAKCFNFIDQSRENIFAEETDGFYPFQTLACADGAENCTEIEGYDVLTDTRQYPDNLRCNSEAGLFSWEEARLRAENDEQFLYDFQEPLGEIFLDVLDKTLPGNCFGRNTVPTGVTVILADGPAQLDGVCTNPGCTYTADGGGRLGVCTAGGGLAPGP